MRKLLAASLTATTLTLALTLGAQVRADTPAADPSVNQIYDAAKAGHLDQAQAMMDQVLRDHPTSGKAHYIQAELFAKEGKTALARSELAEAEQLDPGLSHENPRSVAELKSQLGLSSRPTSQIQRFNGAETAPVAAHFPWGTALLVVLVVGALWMLFRRRSTYGSYPVAGGPVGGGAGPGYGGPGYGGGGYGGPVGGGGVGSGIAGGLASGLAVGAGVVAGEELAHHFLDGGNREGVIPAASAEGNDWQPSSNSDMGGSDFGVNDAGSWDDGSGGGGGGGGGGDDWT